MALRVKNWKKIIRGGAQRSALQFNEPTYITSGAHPGVTGEVLGQKLSLCCMPVNKSLIYTVLLIRIFRYIMTLEEKL